MARRRAGTRLGARGFPLTGLTPLVRIPRRPVGLRFAAVFALSTAVVSVLLAGGARSAGNATGLIAFARADGIYVMRADGTGVRPLRRGGVASDASDLAWSPDGGKLAFVSHFVKRGIWVMDADGRNLERLVAATAAYGPAVMSPTWSPDGRRIAFTRRSYGDRDIWVVNADGSNARRLARTPRRFEWEVDWSPSGGRIAFSDAAGLAPHVAVIDTDGGNVRVLVPGLADFEASPTWSPDGRRIAFMHWREPFRSAELYVADPGGRSQVRLTRNEVPDSAPTWSPDGRRIAFVRWTAKTEAPCVGVPAASCGPSAIYVMNADGTGATRLTRNRTAGSPAWQPVSAG
jgi:TolB protein